MHNTIRVCLCGFHIHQHTNQSAVILNSSNNIGQQYVVVSIWAVATNTAGPWFYKFYMYNFYRHHHWPTTISLPTKFARPLLCQCLNHNRFVKKVPFKSMPRSCTCSIIMCTWKDQKCIILGASVSEEKWLFIFWWPNCSMTNKNLNGWLLKSKG